MIYFQIFTDYFIIFPIYKASKHSSGRWIKENLLLGIRFHGRWSRQASGRLIKVKYTGNSLGGIWNGRSRQVVV